jgi:hypothetical protein
MSTKTYTPRTITFRSHHETDVVSAALQLLEVQTEGEMERARKFEDEEMMALCEIRQRRIVEARWNLLGHVTPSVEAA